MTNKGEYSKASKMFQGVASTVVLGLCMESFFGFLSPDGKIASTLGVTLIGLCVVTRRSLDSMLGSMDISIMFQN
jgi:hypothetical protein